MIAVSPQFQDLRACLTEPSIWAVMVHGLGGIGKSTLLRAAANDARASGRQVVELDCTSMEPTEAGFLQALGTALGLHELDLEGLPQHVPASETPLLLTLDSYENFRLMDTWLRQVLLPSLEGRAQLLIAGRGAPLLQWSTDPVVGAHFRSLRLDTLDDASAREILVSAGVGDSLHERILQLAHGHPLALRLAAAASTELQSGTLHGQPLDRVLHELTRFYVSEIEDPRLRAAVEAASTVRRVSATMLGALLELDAADDLYDELGALHFVEPHADGLSLHDAVREFVSAELQSRDPSRFAAYRRAAWRQMRREMQRAPSAQLWRYTADLIYLMENPVIREAFFPTDAMGYAVEPARPDDRDAVLEISRLHEPPEATACLEHWWLCAPESFYIARGPDGSVAGFYCSLDSTRVDPEDLGDDPLTMAWWDDLQAAGSPQALFLRRWLSREDGESPSPVQAACWLDLKRSYLELRPALRRVYLTLQDLTPYLPVALRLGFAPVESAVVEFGPSTYASAALDFGPRSVDGWMQQLFVQELGSADPARGEVVDLAARQLITPEGREDLSPLEFGVMRMLIENEGDPVSRAALLAEVWGVHHEGSSNVVDAMVRGLRRKLGPNAELIESVRGVGYRYSAPD